MDSGRFDRLARVLGRSLDRRSGLRGAVAFAAALALGPAGEVAARQGRGKGRGDDRVTAQGPCGDGSAQANDCTRDGECCTGYCDRKRGRCRCRRRGQSCTANRNCCSGRRQRLTCQNRTCRPAVTCLALGEQCVPDGEACCTNVAADAECAGGLSPNRTCQDCDRPMTAEGAFCGDPQGNQCCDGNPTCFVGVKAEDDSLVCLADGFCSETCVDDDGCPGDQVCFQIAEDSPCCPGGETAACGVLCVA